MNKQQKLVKYLASKISKKALVELFILTDSDPPAGPLWEALAEKAKEIKPELFDDPDADKMVKKPAKWIEAYLQYWEESERGWGVRPDGCSLHLSLDDSTKYVKNYTKTLPKEVPDEYSRVSGPPISVFVSEVIYNRIRESEAGIRLFQWDMKNRLVCESKENKTYIREKY